MLVADDGQGSDDEDEPEDVPNLDGMPMPQPGQPGDGSPAYIDINQVIDGETYFRDVYADYYDAMVEALGGADVPADVKAMIEAYFGIIK